MEAAGGAPLLLLDRVGEGRVALLLSDQIWLWSRGHEGGGPQAELLRRVAHWLMQEPELEEEALTARIEDGRLQVQRRSVETAPPPEVTVTAPDGSTRRAPLQPGPGGRATAELPADQPGVWQVSDGRRTAFAAAAAANPLEVADLRADPAGWRRSWRRPAARPAGSAARGRAGAAGAAPRRARAAMPRAAAGSGCGATATTR